MQWNLLFALRSYVRSSLWVVPFFAIPLELIATRILHAVDERAGYRLLGLGAEGARSMLEVVITATLSFSVFTFGSLLVAIQVASGQLTPRIIATTLLRDNVVRYTVGLFIFTLFFAVSAYARIGTDVRQLVVFTAALLGIFCFSAFLYLIDYAARLLRPVSILARVGDNGVAVVDSVYPAAVVQSQPPADQSQQLKHPDRVIGHVGTSEIVVAIQTEQLIAEARRLDGVIEFVPQVGDFVAVDEPLFNLYGGAAGADDGRLRGLVAFGTERTLEQDPTFAFRIVIDIALRALSAAINDPTTAVLAIDQVHRMLRVVGKRQLRTAELPDESGRLRVIVRTPNWEDFVHLAFSEIRACGADKLQVVRRLRAMIDNLIKTLPESRHPALLRELSLLDQEVTRNFIYPEEIALAQISDTQGLGGHSR